MKIFITGATGFVGENLSRRLTSSGHDVHVLIREKSSATVCTKIAKTFLYNGEIGSLIAYFQKEKFDGVVHLASKFLSQHQSSDVQDLILSNILFGTELLEASIKAGVGWFINTGTFWQHYDNKSYSPVNLYASTKQAFEDVARYYIETFGLIFVTIKLSDTFGPGDIRLKLMNLWIKSLKETNVLEMSAGEQIIDVNYIDNVVDAYVQMIGLVSQSGGEIYGGKSFAVCSQERMTLKAFAKLFEEVAGKKLNIEWGRRPYRPREVMVPWEDGDPVPGWSPKVSLKEGIKKTLDWKG